MNVYYIPKTDIACPKICVAIIFIGSHTTTRYALSFSQQTDFERLARWCNKMYSSKKSMYAKIFILMTTTVWFWFRPNMTMFFSSSIFQHCLLRSSLVSMSPWWSSVGESSSFFLLIIGQEFVKNVWPYELTQRHHKRIHQHN